MTEKKYGASEVELAADPKNWEIWDGPKSEEIIYQSFPEWTCLCPRSGYPDFGTVHIVMIPNKKVLELKHLKLWLNSFRNVGISHENATHTIAETLFEVLGLKYVYVLMEYKPRGNLITFPMIELEREDVGYPNKFEVRFIKERLLNKIL